MSLCWEQEPSVSVTNQAVRVTSEASDGQSAMEMVILYCVSLEGTERALVWRFPSSGVSGSSVLTGQTSPAGFAALLGLMGQKDPSTWTDQAQVLTCTFLYRSQCRSDAALCWILVRNSNMLFGENHIKVCLDKDPLTELHQFHLSK